MEISVMSLILPQKSKMEDPIPQLAYFNMDLKNNYFDLVVSQIRVGLW